VHAGDASVMLTLLAEQIVLRPQALFPKSQDAVR
jgi:hypothetical protein